MKQSGYIRNDPLDPLNHIDPLHHGDFTRDSSYFNSSRGSSGGSDSDDNDIASSMINIRSDSLLTDLLLSAEKHIEVDTQDTREKEEDMKVDYG